MSTPLVASLCIGAARRSAASSSWGRIASSSTPSTLALLQGRRCFSHNNNHDNNKPPPLRRNTTNDIVGGRSTIGVFTPITAGLWIERLRREEGATLPPKAADGPPLPPSASAVAVAYDFTRDAQLRELYRNPWGGVRVGRVLEDLDSLAGSIALNHFDGGNRSEGDDSERRRRPPVLVTASVDAIKLLSPLSVDQDVEARGQVVWTGKSSMDIRLELYSMSSSSKEREEGCSSSVASRSSSSPSSSSSSSSNSSPALVAHFTFACRDEENRPLAIPQLAPETAVERERFAERATLAEARRRLRGQAKKSAAGSGGASEGGDLNDDSARVEAIADLLLREAAAAADLPALAAGDAVPAALTAAGNTFLCQPQQRNITGRVFGGFLMRRAFELAFASCYVHCGFRPRFTELERVEFMAPVSVGDLLRLRGKVLHVSSSSSAASSPSSEATVRIKVRADVVKPEQAASEVSNTFVFAFKVPLRGDVNEEGAVRVKRVLPETREEALAAAAYESRE